MVASVFMAGASILLVLSLLSACGGADEAPPSDPHAGHGADHDADHGTNHGAGHEAAAPAGPITSLAELITFVQDGTGSCADATTASTAEFADFIGPMLLDLYEPFVAEWATCSIPSFPKLGLILFKPGMQKDFEISWKRALDSGRVTGDPVFSFGDGYAVTSLAVYQLGLYRLSCNDSNPAEGRIPAHTDGCYFVSSEHH